LVPSGKNFADPPNYRQARAFLMLSWPKIAAPIDFEILSYIFGSLL